MSRINASSRELAAFLSTQLGALAASEGLRIDADGPDVVIRDGDGRASRNGTAAILDDADDSRSSAERTATAARAILGHVQDVITQETGKPWPGAGPELPVPGAAVENGTLTAWFGEREEPAWLSDGLPLPA